MTWSASSRRCRCGPRLRDGKLALTPQITTVLLQMVDTARALLASIEQTGVEGDIDTEAVQVALAG